MTQTIRAVFTNALAAHASYVAGLAPQDPDLATKLAEELTRHLASRVDASLTVVTQFVDPRGNGFSATVFVDTEGKRYLSFRGTNDLSDALSDLDAYLSGAVRSQIVAMVNWFMRASTPATEQVVQLLERPSVDWN